MQNQKKCAAQPETAFKYTGRKSWPYFKSFSINCTEHTYKIYIQNISKIKPLAAKEEYTLSRKIKTGDAQAKQQLIEANLKLVVKIAKKYSDSRIHLMDLIQEGNMGLMHATCKYDCGKNIKFHTYAAYWIKNYILRAIYKQKGTIRLPIRKAQSLSRIKSLYSTLSNNNNQAVKTIARETGFSEKLVQDMIHFSHEVLSIDGNNSNPSCCIKDIYPDASYQPEKEFFKKMMKEDIQRLLQLLKERERLVILKRYAFTRDKKCTLREISEYTGLSIETIRRIENKAMQFLSQYAGDLKFYMSDPIYKNPPVYPVLSM